MNAAHTSDSPELVQIDAPLGLDTHELQGYYGIWQRPESRFTNFGVGAPHDGSSWILVCPSEITAQIYIGFDAAQNGRSRADYDARRLTLPDAFDEARNQLVPVCYTTGAIYCRMGGVAVFDIIGSQFKIIDLLPL
jgi:hypothetical protein